MCITCDILVTGYIFCITSVILVTGCLLCLTCVIPVNGFLLSINCFAFVAGFVQFIQKDISDSCMAQLEITLRLLMQLLSQWRSSVSNMSIASCAANHRDPDYVCLSHHVVLSVKQHFWLSMLTSVMATSDNICQC